MKPFNYLLPLAAAAALTACSVDDDNNVQSFTYTLAANTNMTVYPSHDGQWKAADGANIQLKVSFNDATMDIMTTPIAYAPEKTVSFNFEKFPFRQADYNYSYTASSPAVKGYDAAGQPIDVSNFEFYCIITVSSGINGSTTGVTYYTLSGEIDGQPFRLVKAQQATPYYGMTSLQRADQPTTTSRNMVYTVSLNPKTMKAAVTVLRPEFCPKYAQSSIQFTELPFTITSTGFLVNASEFTVSDVPLMQDVAPKPIEGESGTNLTASVGFRKGLSLTFHYAPDWNISFSGAYFPTANVNPPSGN